MALTDPQINTLERKGYREGDTIPGVGRILPDGNISFLSEQGGSQPKLQPTSSVGPMLQRQADDAKHRAISSLVTPPQAQDPYMQFMQQNQQQNDQMTQQILRAQRLSFNSALAANDHAYSQMFQSLASEHQKAVEIAESNAASLNPYSQAKGAQTAQNFTNKINADFQKQSLNLQRQADLARQQLEAGNATAYVSIMQAAQKQNQEFIQGMFDHMAEQQRLAQNQFEIEQNAIRFAVDDYVGALAQALPSPEEIRGMSDEQLLRLPAVQQGLRAGYDLNGIRTDLVNASTLQATAQSRASEEFSLDRAYRLKQIENIDDQMRNRNSSGNVPNVDIPSFEEYLSQAELLAGQTFTPQTRAQVRQQYLEAYGQYAGQNQPQSYTREQLLKLEQAGLLNAPRQQQLDHLYQDGSGLDYDSL